MVKAKHGNSVVLDSNGTEYKRNVTHVKKYVDKPSCQENIIPSFVASQHVDSQQDLPVDPPLQTNDSPKPCDSESTSAELSTSVLVEPPISRPQRARRMPTRFKDYELSK